MVKDELLCLFVFGWYKNTLSHHFTTTKLSAQRSTSASAMAPDLLDPSALIATLPSLLPEGKKTLDSPQDAIAALLHTALTAVSFRLTGVDESTRPSVSVSDNILPAGWNKHGPGYYTLVYKHDQSSLEFLIKLTKLGKRTVINAIALQVGDHLFYFQYQHS